MKISLEFDSVAEMKHFYDGINFQPYGTVRAEKLKQEAESAPVVAETPPEPETKPEEPKEEAAPAAEEKIAVADVRKLLSIVNKKSSGKNVAKEWIAEEGFSTLADIDDQEVLKRLKAKAEEVINAE